MTYEGKKTTRLNKTIIEFWNAGKKTIDEKDLVPEYFKIDFDSINYSKTYFFVIEVTEISRESIQVEVLESDDNIIFKFNYLDHKDYFVIEILHSGESIPDSIEGNVKGVKGLVKQSIRKKKNQLLNMTDIEETRNEEMIQLFIDKKIDFKS